MSGVDTSAEAVAHRAQELESWGLDSADRAAALLRALAAERDAALTDAARREAEGEKRGLLKALGYAYDAARRAARGGDNG